MIHELLSLISLYQVDKQFDAVLVNMNTVEDFLQFGKCTKALKMYGIAIKS